LFLYLAIGVLLLVYALGFISDVYLFYAYGGKALADFYHEMQSVNGGLLWKAVLIIIFSLVLFMLELGRHPAGLITMILTALIAAVSVSLCVHSLALLVQARQTYAGLDLSSLNRYIERGAIRYQYSTLTYDLGMGGYALFLLSSLFMAITVIRNAFTVKDGA
jgi:hypothetical protein